MDETFNMKNDYMSEKVFAGVFANIKKIHLIKDPGMIPFTMSKSYGFHAVIPISDKHDYEPFAGCYYTGIEMPVICDSSATDIFQKKKQRAKWILRNAKNIDVLGLFFFESWTWIDIFFYKLRNRKGIVYVHMDTDGRQLVSWHEPKNPLKKRILHFLLSPKVLNDTLWGIQNQHWMDQLDGKWPFLNLKYVPDGVWWPEDEPVSFEEKENIILTVARIGAAPKRSDLFLSGGVSVLEKFPDWRLKLVGTVEDSFRPVIEEFFGKYPHLKERVEFVGPVYDRRKLREEYDRAKIFCLTSAWESFGIVVGEAMSRGCFIVGSDIPSTRELIREDQFGILFRNGCMEELSQKLSEAISDENRLRKNCALASAYVQNHLTWEKAILPVRDWIENKLQDLQ